MKASTNQHLIQDVKTAQITKQEKLYTKLDSETRATLSTDEAAFHLNRRAQTLRIWACLENGPIRPVRINGRLAWPVSAINSLLKGGAQ